MQCPHCQAEMPDIMKFCGACGKPLVEFTCLQCGFSNPGTFQFCGNCGSRLPTPVAAAVDSPPDLPGQAERRQLTVLFADLVGSTALTGSLEPEDMSELLRAYRRICAGAVKLFEGHVAQFQGDGLLAFFGYPQAHEDNVERAVRAGLHIIEAVQRLNGAPHSQANVELAVRIGIAAGTVVTDVQPPGDEDDYLVVGQALNLAARLQAVAQPNTLVITSRIRRHLGGLFEYEDLGYHDLKGLRDLVHIWRVCAARPTESRFEAIHDSGLPSFVNRQQELEGLLHGWQRAGQGDGQVILLNGEPGIGKSRLAQTFRERIEVAPHLRLQLQCSPYFSNTALYPFIYYLERVAGLSEIDAPGAKLDKLQALLTTDSPEVLALFAALLSIPGDGRFPPLPLSPLRQKELLQQALVNQVIRSTATQPVLLFIEDVHWLDPTSLEVLDLLVAAAPGRRLFILITFRPQFTPPWTDQPHVSLITVNRLEQHHSVDLVREVAGASTLPKLTVNEIVTKTDGNPLFIEELTKTLLTTPAEALSNGEGGSATGTALPVPFSLKDSLMARLDWLNPGKTVAQIASVIGRDFSYDLLAAIAPFPDKPLRLAIQQLMSAGLVFHQGLPGRTTYTFKHALLRDAAYDSLVRQRREQLHHQLADVLEDRAAGNPSVRPELVAFHYSAAGVAEKAVKHWLEAGRQAYARSANQEAVAHFQQALDELATLSDSPHRRQRELEIRIHLGAALISTRGPGSKAVAEIYERALQICAQLPESPLHFAAYWGWWRVSANFQIFRERANQLLTVAERLHDPALQLQAHHCQWAVLFNLGDQRSCCEHIDKGLELYAQGDYRTHASLYGGHDPAVCAHGEAALSLWLLGYPDQSLLRAQRAQELAQELNQAGSRAHALDLHLMLRVYRREAAVVREQAATLRTFAREQGFPDYVAKSQIFLGWALALRGDTEHGIDYMHRGIAALRKIGTREDFPNFFDMLAEVYGLAGRHETGLAELTAAFHEAEESGTQHWLAELHRRRGELLLAGGMNHGAEAAECFAQALAIAGRQNAHMLELRAATSLARWRLRQDQPEQAHQLLGPIYDSFSEGLDTPDLCEAGALLETLSRAA